MANVHIREDSGSSNEAESSAPCVFCERSDVGPSEVGETYTKDGVTVHQYCLVSLPCHDTIALAN